MSIAGWWADTAALIPVFPFDVTDYLIRGKKYSRRSRDDENHPAQVRGKQRWKKENSGCWYVQTTGIYKSVWMEYVEDVYLTGVKITPSLKDYTVRFDASVSAPAEDVEIRFAISFDGRPIRTVCVSAADIENSVSVKLDSAISLIRWNNGASGVPRFTTWRSPCIKRAGKRIKRAAISDFGSSVARVENCF